MKKLFLAVGLIVALIVFNTVGCGTTESAAESVVINNQQQGISVNGQGKVAVTPDISILTLGIQSQELSVASAQVKAIDSMNKVVSVLTGNGIANKDIQTQRFSIQVVTKYDNTAQKEVVVGYMVTNVVTVKIRTIDNTGSIIDAVAAVGGDLIRIEGINFSVDDPTTSYNQAREKAVADAKEKADKLAKLAGVTLGKPTFISESTSLPIRSPIKAADSATTPISPGFIDISATVQIIYSISK